MIINNSGGCFIGDCIVKIVDKSEKYVCDLKKGDGYKKTCKMFDSKNI